MFNENNAAYNIIKTEKIVFVIRKPHKNIKISFF